MFLNFDGWSFGGRYSLVLVGSGIKTVSKTFSTSHSATEEMYRLIKKHCLSIVEVYNNKTSKSYICSNGAEFHISRI